MSEQNNYELGPDFGLREDLQKRVVSNIVTNGEKWTLDEGDYYDPFYADSKLVLPERRSFGTELLGTEVILYEIMKKKLNEERSNDTPCLFVDFGGMLGATFCKIAIRLENEEFAISKSKACFVVTNINFSPKDKKVDWRNSSSPQVVEIIDRGVELVNYVSCDASKITDGSASVILKNGKTLPLKGNITVFHESSTFMHLLTPDNTVPHLANCLEENGIFLFRVFSEFHSNVSNFSEEINALSKSINDSYDNINVNLARSKMTRLNIPTKIYKIYQKRSNSNTPVFDFPDTKQIRK